MLKTAMTRSAIIVFVCSLAFSAHAMADGARRAIHIPSGDMASALDLLAKQSGADVVYRPEQVQGFRTKGVDGELSTEEAVARLLQGTPLILSIDSSGAMLIALPTPTAPSQRAKVSGATSAVSSPSALHLAQAQSTDRAAGRDKAEDSPEPQKRELTEVIVTGTLIRGGHNVGSPELSYDREDIESSGATTTEGFFSKLAENVGGTATARSQNVSNDRADVLNSNAGSSINLRGAGGGSTLVLLNGHRLTPSGAGGYFDVSMIPLAAIQRIDIVPDGASSLYGSDAVGGVVNFILRRDYRGAETTLNYSGATRGGYADKEISQILGTDWESGGIFGTFDYDDRDALDSSDRGFSAGAGDPNALVPGQRRRSGYVAAHQKVTDWLNLEGDLLYSKRNVDAPYTDAFGSTDTDIDASLWQSTIGASVTLPFDWTATLNGTQGEESTDRLTLNLPSLTTLSFSNAKFRERSVNAIFSGPLLSLPAGELRASVGGEYRDERLDNLDTSGRKVYTRDAHAAFGEILVPLVGPQQGLSGVHRLELNASVRNEHYRDVGDTTNPKFGISYMPIADLTFRGSWGTSFRAPRLLDLTTSAGRAILRRTADPNAPGGTIVVLTINGGNPDLKPEKADTWSAGFDWKPAAVPGLNVGFTYYSIDYTDRLTTIPVAAASSYTASAVTFAPLVTLNPASDVLQHYISTLIFRNNYGPYNLSDIKALGDFRLNNAGTQIVRGMDLNVRYSAALAGGSLTTAFAVNYFSDFTFKSSDSAPAVPVLDTSFNPVDIRARLSGMWTRGWFSGGLAVNYVDGYTDNIAVPRRGVPSWTTIDASLGINFANVFDGPAAEGLKLSLDVANLFDRSPPYVTGPALRPALGYDAQNADPLGRIITVVLRKSW